ncbi:MAG: hypothetical protein TUN42_08385 [Dehalogenimonas sp.]
MKNKNPDEMSECEICHREAGFEQISAGGNLGSLGQMYTVWRCAWCGAVYDQGFFGLHYISSWEKWAYNDMYSPPLKYQQEQEGSKNDPPPVQ